MIQSTRKFNPATYLLLPVLAALGYAGNYFNVPLFFGVEFLFGSIPVLVAVFLFGPLWGTLAAVVAGSYTYFLWGHPYAAVILAGEALVVGLLLNLRRGHLPLYTGLYWLFIGMPLVWIFYHFRLGTDWPGTQLLMLKQAVNGIFNGLIAGLIVAHTPVRGWSGWEEDRIPTLQQILFNLLAAMVLFPALFLMVLEGRRGMNRVEAEVNAELQATVSALRNRLDDWLEGYFYPVAQTAQRMRAAGVTVGEVGDELIILRRSFPHFRLLGILDPRDTLVAAAPPASERGERFVGRNLGGSPYVRQMRETGRPVISDVVTGGSGLGGPSVVIGVPILVGREYRGAALGALNLASLSGMMEGYGRDAGAQATVVDGRLRVIASTRPELQPSEGFAYPPGGQVRWLDSNRFRWQPAAGGITPMTRWKDTLYGRKAALEDVPWSLIVQSPVAPHLGELQSRYIDRLLVLLGLSVLALVISMPLAWVLARPLGELAEATVGLPERLFRRGEMTWPEARVQEMRSLVGNFRAMAASLQGRLDEARLASATIEESGRQLMEKNTALEAGRRELAEKNEALEAHGSELAEKNRSLEVLSRELEEKNTALTNEIRERQWAEEALIRRARMSACGAEISTLLAQGEDLPSTLRGCAEALVNHLDVAFARIWTLNEAENVLELRAAAGSDASLDESLGRIPYGETIVGQIAAEGRPFLTNDLRRDSKWVDEEWADREGVVSFSGYPLAGEGDAIGVLAVCAPWPVPEEMQNELASTADGIAQFLRRRRAEAALAESERRFRALIEGSSDAIAVIGEDGIIRYASPSTERVLGYTPEEAVGQHIFEGMHPEDRERVQPAVQELFRQPHNRIRVEYRYVHKDGTWRWLEGTGTNLLSDPSVGGIVANYRDVSDRKALEADLRQRAHALAEAGRRKDEFLAMLAHELRNPLGPVLNAVHLLREGDGSGPAQERAREVIERQVRHMARIIDDLLDVSRITRGKADLRPERLDLSEQIRSVVRDHRTMFEEARLNVSLDLPEQAVWVEGDPTRLSQVLGNLLNNAIKFTDPFGLVTVRLAEDPTAKQVRLTVKDTGIGIEPGMLPYVFDAFAQADRSLERSRGGLGLGLALVRGLVKLHGGEVIAHSEGPGRGAEFTVTLPLADAPEQTKEPSPAAPAEVAPLKLLVIEDNPDAAQSLRDLLADGGHRVEVASTGPEGLAAALRFRPDVAICDLGLPGMDGYAVAAVLRKQFPEMGLVALSGYGRGEDRQRSAAAGFDRHLVKPVDPDRLRQALSDLSRRSPALR